MYKISNSPLKKKSTVSTPGAITNGSETPQKISTCQMECLAIDRQKNDISFTAPICDNLFTAQPGLHRMTVIAHAIILDSSNNHLHAGQNGGTFKITILKRSTDLKLNPGTPLSLIAYLCVVHNLVFLKSN